MHIGRVPASEGRDQPKVGEQGVEGHSVLLPRVGSLLGRGDTVSISKGLRAPAVAGYAQQIRERFAGVDEARVESARERLANGELSTKEVLEETARRILEGLAG